MKYIKPETTITTAVLSTIIMGSNKEQGKVNPVTGKGGNDGDNIVMGKRDEFTFDDSEDKGWSTEW
jgi:hypothetical protein